MMALRRLVWAATLLVMVLPGVASAASDLERTWQRAYIAAPTETAGRTAYFRLDSKKAKAYFRQQEGKKYPVIMYLHGCTGFSSADKTTIRSLASAGYIVVAPDSMARKYRPRQCSGRSQKGGANLFVFDFRQAEISFAVDQLWRADWADFSNMYLVGVSEGGLATAHHRGDYFRARVITQWTCHGSSLVHGISAPEQTPILSIVRKSDPWYNGEGTKQAGDCGAYFGNRPGSRSVVLENGYNHSVMADDDVLSTILDFLGANRAEPMPQKEPAGNPANNIEK